MYRPKLIKLQKPFIELKYFKKSAKKINKTNYSA